MFKRLETIKRIARYLPIVLVLGGLLVFFVSLLATSTRKLPGNLELPWSGFEDFTQTKDGSVYVSLRFYERILRYDSSGRFLASYPAPGAGYGGLATDVNGRIYFRLRNSVHTYDADWHLLAKSKCDFYGDRSWILNAKEEAECAPGKGSVQVPPERAVYPGELLFSSERIWGKNHFDCVDGSSINRKGDRLYRYGGDGKLLSSYGTPWYLWWAKFPVPLAGAWVIMFLFGILENQKVRQFLSRRK
jgi:hypothetical protein